MTAHRPVFADGGVQGLTVLVQGGAGSVGHLAVQLARWGGARVIATAGSDAQTKVARECGAHHVLSDRSDDVAAEVLAPTGGSRVDRVVEVAFARNLDVDARALRPSGTLATYSISEDATHPESPNLQQLLTKDVAMRFTLVYAMPWEAHERAARDLGAALAAGALRPRIAARFPLERIAEAHGMLGTGGAGGKVLVDIG